MQRSFNSLIPFTVAAVLVASTAMMVVSTPWSQETGEEEEEMTVLDGKLVTFEYTLKDGDGNVIDSSSGGQPFVYTHGHRQVVPGLEQELAGMRVGESKLVIVQPQQGYGAVNEEAFVQVPIEKIPADARQVGQRLQGTSPDGQPVFPIVKEVRESVVVLDFNHPLAGETLHFDVKILTIEEGAEAGAADAGAQAEED